jgi:hypothetical protein
MNSVGLMRVVPLCLLVVALCASPATAQSQQTVTLTADAPVFVTPSANQSPIRVGKRGSVLRLLDATDGWVHVEFQDPQFGRREGYVERRFVEISAPQQPAVPLSPPPQSTPDRPAQRPQTQPPAPQNGGPGFRRGDVSVGYSFLHYSDVTMPLGIVSADAWRVHPVIDFVVEGQYSHGNADLLVTSVGANTWSLLGGPRFWGSSRYGQNVREFGEILGGVVTERATIGSLASGSATGFGFQPGFGVEVPVSRTVAIRPQFDVLISRISSETAYATRFNVNVVFRLFRD